MHNMSSIVSIYIVIITTWFCPRMLHWQCMCEFYTLKFDAQWIDSKTIAPGSILFHTVLASYFAGKSKYGCLQISSTGNHVINYTFILNMHSYARGLMDVCVKFCNHGLQASPFNMYNSEWISAHKIAFFISELEPRFTYWNLTMKSPGWIHRI